MLMAMAISIPFGTAIAVPGAASADETINSAWNSVWSHSSDKRALDLSIAEKSELARRGGYGAGNSYNDTYVEEQNNTFNHYGDEFSSNATNVVNSSSVENRTNVGDNNTGVYVIPTTTGAQTSGTATQGATTQTTSTDNGGTTAVDVSTSTGG